MKLSRVLPVAGIPVLAPFFLLAAGPASAAPPTNPAASAAAASQAADHVPVCGPADPNSARCDAIQLIDPAQNWRGSPERTSSNTTSHAGYGPTSLLSAYSLTSAAAQGSGQTVAIVDAYDDPYAEANVGSYRSYYGLSSCTTGNGCFKKVNETGGTRLPRANASWSEEISLDLDMVSAICPNCHILLVEANSASYSDLGTAENFAAGHANVISNSYGGSDSSSDSSYDSAYYKHSGVVITASTGDSGYGVEYPAASPYVIAAGGTSLSQASNSRGWTETAWSDAGSGCSKYEVQPSWQASAVGSACANRAVADVSAVADPNTGVAVYDSYGEPGWMVFGGTSVASPLIASVFALAGNAATFSPASLYSTGASLYDVTTGSNGSCGGSALCTAGPGWDGPTGLGTPDGTGAF